MNLNFVVLLLPTFSKQWEYCLIYKLMGAERSGVYSSGVPKFVIHKTLDICLICSAARGRGSNASSTNAQRSNTRQTACIHCSQTGHSSNDCPSRVPRSRNSQSHRTNMPSGTLLN